MILSKLLPLCACLFICKWEQGQYLPRGLLGGLNERTYVKRLDSDWPRVNAQ